VFQIEQFWCFKTGISVCQRAWFLYYKRCQGSEKIKL